MSKICFFALFIITTKQLAAQSEGVKPELTGASSAIDQNLYNGIEHLGYPSTIEGYAYYFYNDWRPGTVVYNQAVYKNVVLKYDLFKNELILRHYNGFTGITLFSPRVQAFSIDNHKFKYFPETNSYNMPTGFSEELQAGNASLYAARSKKLQESTTTGNIEKRFVAKNEFYLLKEGTSYKIKNPKALLKYLDAAVGIRNYLKNNFSDDTDPEFVMSKLVEYYNQTSH